MTLYERVLTELGEAICGGVYPPGAVIPAEPLLCERHQVSRVVVREAIKGLAAKGMVELRRKTGTIVLPPARWQLFDADVVAWRAKTCGMDHRLAADLIELRRVVEPAAARFAAARATDADRRAIRAAYAAMERAVAGDGDYVPADAAFHSRILAACGNPFIRRMDDALSAVLRTSFEIVARTPGGPASSLPMHRALCEAIARGDAAGAERAALDIIDRAEVDLQRRIRLARRPAAAGRAPRSTTP